MYLMYFPKPFELYGVSMQWMDYVRVDFSSSGRNYTERDSGLKTEEVAIGTNNSQKKDLAFFEGVG